MLICLVKEIDKFALQIPKKFKLIMYCSIANVLYQSLFDESSIALKCNIG